MWIPKLFWNHVSDINSLLWIRNSGIITKRLYVYGLSYYNYTSFILLISLQMYTTYIVNKGNINIDDGLYFVIKPLIGLTNLICFCIEMVDYSKYILKNVLILINIIPMHRALVKCYKFMNDRCVICYDKTTFDGIVVMRCGHHLHSSCFETYNMKNKKNASKCPVCSLNYNNKYWHIKLIKKFFKSEPARLSLKFVYQLIRVNNISIWNDCIKEQFVLI